MADHSAALAEHCTHARYVWNLAVEQLGYRSRGQRMPGYAEQNQQLTEARRAFDWLGAGSVTVQQQAVRDFHQAMSNWRASTHRMPTWRKRGRNEGFRIVGAQAQRVEQVNRRWSLHARNRDARKDFVEKASTAIARAYDLIRVEDLRVANMTRSARGTIETPGRNVRQKAGLNRSILAGGWSVFTTRLEQKAPVGSRRSAPRSPVSAARVAGTSRRRVNREPHHAPRQVA